MGHLVTYRSVTDLYISYSDAHLPMRRRWRRWSRRRMSGLGDNEWHEFPALTYVIQISMCSKIMSGNLFEMSCSVAVYLRSLRCCPSECERYIQPLHSDPAARHCAIVICRVIWHSSSASVIVASVSRRHTNCIGHRYSTELHRRQQQQRGTSGGRGLIIMIVRIVISLVHCNNDKKIVNHNCTHCYPYLSIHIYV